MKLFVTYAVQHTLGSQVSVFSGVPCSDVALL